MMGKEDLRSKLGLYHQMMIVLWLYNTLRNILKSMNNYCVTTKHIKQTGKEPWEAKISLMVCAFSFRWLRQIPCKIQLSQYWDVLSSKNGNFVEELWDFNNTNISITFTRILRPILLSSVVVCQHVSTEVPGSIPGGGLHTVFLVTNYYNNCEHSSSILRVMILCYNFWKSQNP